MAEEHLVYDFGIESLLRGLGTRLTPELKARLRGLGIDADKKLLPAYPKALWVKAVDLVAEHVRGEGDLAAAHRRLGHDIASGFEQSAFGKVVAPGVRFIGVKRVLLRLPRQLTMTNNFMRVAVVELAGDVMRVEMNEAVPSADFLCGVIAAIAGYAGAKSCDVTYANEGALIAFTVSWT